MESMGSKKLIRCRGEGKKVPGLVLLRMTPYYLGWEVLFCRFLTKFRVEEVPR